MSNTMWATIILIVAGFLFGKLIREFIGYLGRSIKDSEEEREARGERDQ